MSLQPGDTLLRCSGQDVTRKGAKGKGRIMMALPAQLALGKNCDGQLGTLEKADTDNPEFVVTTVEGTYFFPGEFICSTNNYFTISCEPKKRQSVCQDVFDRLLVFKEPIFVPAKTSITMSTNLYQNEIMETDESIDKLIGSSQATDSGLGNQYTRHHGCSHLAEPVKISTEKILNKLSTTRSTEIEDNDSDSDISAYMPSTDEISMNRRLSSRSNKAEVKYNESDDNSEIYFDDFSDSKPKVNKKSVNSKEKVESISKKAQNSVSKKTKSKKQIEEIDLASDSDSDAVANKASTKKKVSSKKSDSTSKSKSKSNKQIKRKRASSDEDDESSEFSDIDDDNNDSLNVSNITSRSSRDRKKVNYSQLDNDDNEDDEDDNVDDIYDSGSSSDGVKKTTKKVKKATAKTVVKTKQKKSESVETIDLLRSSDEEWDE